MVVDDFRTGRREFVGDLADAPERARWSRATCWTRTCCDAAMPGCDTVFHLQANADVRFGFDRPQVDLEQNMIADLERARGDAGDTECQRIAFSSTGSVYGEPDVFPTPEDCPFPVQTSLYGASKLAARGPDRRLRHGFGFTGVVFRFVSILGERYTHGHVYDFYRALKRRPDPAAVLGDGRQEKSYLYVGDCVEGILAGLEATRARQFRRSSTSAPTRR